MARAFCMFLLAGSLFASDSNPQTEFWRALEALCGQSYQGEISLNQTTHKLAGPLEIKTRACSPTQIEINFAIGSDRSRTWILSRTQTGLRLKHEHRKPDGSSDKVTNYGGDTAAPGTATRQAFVVDDRTRQLVAGTEQNIWVFEFKDGHLAYELYKGDATPVFQARFAL